MNEKLKSLTAITGVLALVLMVVVSGTALAAPTTLQTLDTSTEFDNNTNAVNSVTFTSPGMEITEGGSWESSVMTFSETPDTLGYNIGSVGSEVQITVYDGSGNTVAPTESITSAGTGSIDISSLNVSEARVNIDVIDDADGTTGEVSTVDSVSFVDSNDAPTASATVDHPGAALPGNSIDLHATDSTDPDGDTLSYAWDLDGDGNFDDATGETVSVSESTAGTYTYNLKVSDGYGGEAIDTVDVTFGTATIEVTDINNVDGSAVSNPEIGIWASYDSETIVDYKEVTLPYTVEVAPGQDYNFWAASSNGDYIRSEQVVSAVDGNTHSLSYTLDYAGVAQFNLVDESGTALDTYDVSFISPEDGSETTMTFATDDTKQLSEIPYNQTTDGTVDLTFQKDGYQSVTKTYSFSDSDRIIEKNVTLESERVIDFTVNDVDGNAIEGATIEIANTDGTVVTTDTTDASGNVSIGGLSDQTYTVSVSATDYQSSSMDIDVSSDGSVTAEMVLSSNVDETNGITSSISYTADDSTDDTSGGVGTVPGDSTTYIIVGGVLLFLIGAFVVLKE